MTAADTRATADAGANATTTATIGRRRPAPTLGPRAALRFLWTQLTAMRTALVLLFLLALAAVPGSLVPQRSVTPVAVRDFIRQHSVLGPLYDRIGLFEVYTSPWFSAVYLLLFLSLIGCIIPRLGVYARAVRRPPPPVPRHLHRLPTYAHTQTDDAGTAIRAVALHLTKRRYRVIVDGHSVAAERGYLREAGNLLFHVSLLVLLLGVAINVSYGFRGSTLVVVGQGFTNTRTQYDDLSSGAAFTDADLVPFAITVNSFDARFETGPVQRGAARLFRADLTVTDRPGDAPYDKALEVNQPLRINGTLVHLIGHGYAPKVTVRDGRGNVAFSGPVPLLPQDGNFTSSGVIKVPDARPDRLAFQAIFVPTSKEGQGPRSMFPDAILPALYLNAFAGSPKVETGIPENVFSFNQAGLTQLRSPDGAVVAVRLIPGTTFILPDGKGSIQFDGWARWVKLQVDAAPGMPVILSAIAAAIAGLYLSLFVRPRRVWVRVSRDEGRLWSVEVAGLDRAESRTGLADEIAELTELATSTEGRANDHSQPSG